MRPRLLLPLPFLLCAASLALAGPAEQLAALIQQSAASGQPVMTFFAGARSMPDQTLDRATIQRALALANVSVNGPLAQVLRASTRIQKQGDRLRIDRSQETTVPLGSSGFARLGRRVTLRVRGGPVSQATPKALKHVGVADPGTGFVYVDDIGGVRLSKDGNDYYELGEMYAYTKNGRPTLKYWASLGGILSGIGKWSTYTFDKPKPKPAPVVNASDTDSSGSDAVVALKYGLASLPLREGPGASHPLITRLEDGTPVKVLSKDGAPFYKVEVDGKVGYVHSDHLRLGAVGIANRIPGQ